MLDPGGPLALPPTAYTSLPSTMVFPVSPSRPTFLHAQVGLIFSPLVTHLTLHGKPTLIPLTSHPPLLVSYLSLTNFVSDRYVSEGVTRDLQQGLLGHGGLSNTWTYKLTA